MTKCHYHTNKKNRYSTSPNPDHSRYDSTPSIKTTVRAKKTKVD